MVFYGFLTFFSFLGFSVPYPHVHYYRGIKHSCQYLGNVYMYVGWIALLL